MCRGSSPAPAGKPGKRRRGSQSPPHRPHGPLKDCLPQETAGLRQPQGCEAGPWRGAVGLPEQLCQPAAGKAQPVQSGGQGRHVPEMAVQQAHGLPSDVPARSERRQVRPAPLAGAEPRRYGRLGGGKELHPVPPGRTGGAGGAAEDARGGDAVEKHAVEPLVVGGDRLPALVICHGPHLAFSPVPAWRPGPSAPAGRRRRWPRDTSWR